MINLHRRLVEVGCSEQRRNLIAELFLMGEFVKEILNSVNSLMLLIVVVLLGIATIGIIPLGADVNARIHLVAWQRLLFGFIAVGIPLAAATIKYFSHPKPVNVQTNDEYEGRLQAANDKNAIITPEDKILAEHEIRKVRFVVYNADIANAKADVLVSSDDNYLQARGGVAKAILDKAGTDTLKELTYYRNFYRKAEPGLGHGDIVVTNGGATRARMIIHPAVIDLFQDRYPNQDLIRRVVRRCLGCTLAFGARSIAFPVLGGGTASKHLNPWDSIQAIVLEFMTFIEKYDLHADGQLDNIALYIYNTKTIAGDLNALFTRQLPPLRGDS